MTKLPGIFCALAAVAVAGCAGRQVYEEAPHHFSKDSQGNRVACYATDVASEYECVPVVRRYDHAHAHPHAFYYDPFWSHRFLYGWPYPYRQVIVVRDPAPRPQPPPHFRPRKGKD